CSPPPSGGGWGEEMAAQRSSSNIASPFFSTLLAVAGIQGVKPHRAAAPPLVRLVATRIVHQLHVDSANPCARAGAAGRGDQLDRLHVVIIGIATNGVCICVVVITARSIVAVLIRD